MRHKKLALATAVAAALGLPVTEAGAAEIGEVEWFGNIYTKFLDGDRRTETALYNNAETTPGEAGGDQGQGIEFELLFRSQVSEQIEINGRIQSRFNRNFWTNFGGFGDEEQDERSAQYVKLRGVAVTITPGYDVIDSATIGSNDWGMFDPWTHGKFRFIDRDNSSGLLFQGTLPGGAVRWDLARVSLSRLFQGPRFLTTFNPNDPAALETNDGAWVGQLKWAATPDLNITTIAEYIRDREINPSETNTPDDLNDPGDPNDGEGGLDGRDTVTRYDNTILALKAQWSVSDAVDLSGAFYWTDFNNDDTPQDDPRGRCNGALNGDCRFSPTLQDDGQDEAWLVNLDINELPLEDLTLSMQLFHIGAEYTSVTAARREADVLLTEGREGSWMWGRPDYNYGNPANANALAGLGYGGWNGEVQQVVSLMADNDFTDFDEPVADAVIGWEGITLVPRYTIGEWELTGEYSWIDFDTNWQACNNAPNAVTGLPDKDLTVIDPATGNTVENFGCKYPRMEGTHAWSVGGDYRSPYAPYQDREMQIAGVRANYTLDLGNGLDLAFRYRYLHDEDKRVTNPALLADAYDGYPEAAIGPQTDWTDIRNASCTDPLLPCLVDDVGYDDREATYHTFGFSAGYQVTPDLYGRFLWDHHTIDLIDGIIDVAPVGMGFEANNDFGYAEYATGEWVKDRIGFQFSYFLSGVEFGASIDWLFGSYEPVFLVGEDGALLSIHPEDPRILTDVDGRRSVVTPLGNIPMDEVDFEQYRLKAFMKVGF
jgi:hypothetical protein